MFSKLSADLTGSADVCSCIEPAKFHEQNSLTYLLAGERPFIVLVSGKEEHIFTDLAYISSKGTSSTISRRLVKRYDYFDHRISNVVFETAGLGISDRDVELKFTIGSEYISIDVWKKQAETLVKYYKVLVALSHQQRKNATMLELSKIAIPKTSHGDIKESIAWAEQVYEKNIPSNYGFVFEQLL
jgi:hypothetical protein